MVVDIIAGKEDEGFIQSLSAFKMCLYTLIKFHIRAKSLMELAS